ncbi:MAG: hypothetical protein ABJN22_02455 [Litorimonas sp.]
MFEAKNICSNSGFTASFLRLCSFVVAFAFLIAQTLSFAHAHDHVGESPVNQTCEVCVLAVNDDGNADILVNKTSDAEDTGSFWVQLDRLALPEPEPAPSVEYAERSIDPPPDPNRRPDLARAPPLYI